MVLDLLIMLPAVLVLCGAAGSYVLRWSISQVLVGAWRSGAAQHDLVGRQVARWHHRISLCGHGVADLVGRAARPQLARPAWVVAICFGLLLVHIAQGVQYRFIDYPDNVRYWEGHKTEELLRRGFEPGTFAAIQFERKILSGEMVGFSISPNTYAAMLVVLGIVAAGAVVQRMRDQR